MNRSRSKTGALHWVWQKTNGNDLFFFYLLGAILLTAFLLRIFLISHLSLTRISAGDQLVFQELADNLFNAQGFWSVEGRSYRLPLYPLTLAALERAFGGYVYIFQCLLGVGGALTLACFVRKLKDNGMGLLAGSIWGFSPINYLYDQQLLAETLYSFLLILMVCAGWKSSSDRKISNSIFFGVTAGIAILCKGEACIQYMCLLCLNLWFLLNSSAPRLSGLVKSIFVPGLITLMVLTPWIGRNYKLLGIAVLSSNQGINFYIGNNDSALGSYYLPEDVLKKIASTPESLRSKVWGGKAAEWIKEHPLKFLSLIPQKWRHLFGSYNNFFLDIFDLFLYFFSLLGLLLAVKMRKIEYLFILCPIVAGLISSGVFFGGDRFRFPLYPFFITFAVCALDYYLKPKSNLTVDKAQYL